MNHTTSLDELLTALSAGVIALGLLAFAMAFVDADPADFDPRPAIRRAVESGRIDPLLIAVTNTRHTLREAALTAAALLMLLSAPPKGATR